MLYVAVLCGMAHKGKFVVKVTGTPCIKKFNR